MSNLIVTQGYGDSEQFVILAVTCTTPSQVTVTFNEPPLLSGGTALAASWSIEATGGAVAVAVQSVQVVGSQVVLTTTQHTDGGAYILHLPDAVVSVNETVLGSSLDQPYAGVGSFPVVQIVKSVDEFTIEIVFSKPMFEEDATNPDNYSIATGVSVVVAEKVTDLNYHLTTTSHVENTLYSLSATGIRDVYLNAVQP